MWIYVIKAKFSASLLQSLVSHDPSEIILICWFAAQETFLIIIINVENSCAAQCFCRNWCILFFRIHRWVESSKDQHLFEIEIFCIIINVFTVTFDQSNAFFFNESINFLKNIINNCIFTWLVYQCPLAVWVCLSWFFSMHHVLIVSCLSC